MIEDISTYSIEIRGQVNEDDINAASPLKATILRAEESKTTLSACTDQSGVVGLIRYLHGMGYVILSFKVEVKAPADDTLAHLQTA